MSNYFLEAFMDNPLLKAHFGFRKNIMNGLKEFDLTPGAPRIMYYLSFHEGCRQKDIARNCFVRSATLTSVLANMEKMHLIDRRRAKDDGRAYSIYPAKEAEDIYKAVLEQYEKVTAIAFEGFTEEETEELKSYLLRMDNNFKKAREAGEI